MSNRNIIGTVVHFEKAYPLKCKDRFPAVETKGYYRRACEPVLIDLKNKTHEGWIVGIRSVVMGDYQGGFYSDEDWDWPSGTKEQVYLVCESPLKTPIIVRLCDARQEDE